MFALLSNSFLVWINFVQAIPKGIKIRLSKLLLVATVCHRNHFTYQLIIYCFSINRTFLIYNRVPKTGSTTMQTILRKLKKVNNFELRSSKDYVSYSKKTLEEQDFVAQILNSNLYQYIHDGHYYYVPFEKYANDFQLSQVNLLWFNIVRNPVNRFISEFYYERRNSRWSKKKQPPKVRSLFNLVYR